MRTSTPFLTGDAPFDARGNGSRARVHITAQRRRCRLRLLHQLLNAAANRQGVLVSGWDNRRTDAVPLDGLIAAVHEELERFRSSRNPLAVHEKPIGPRKKKKNTLSAEGRASIAAAQKRRWARVKAADK